MNLDIITSVLNKYADERGKVVQEYNLDVDQHKADQVDYKVS